jgi:hypothetical protein
LAPFGDEDIGGLEIAMDNAFGVGSVQRVGDLDGQVQQQINL